jgi:hypothetical protein
MQAFTRNFAYGLKALVDQRGGAGGASTEPEPEPEAPAPAAEADEPVAADAAPDSSESE